MVRLQYDGPPLAELEPLVDALDLRLHLGKKVLVALDVKSAQCPELHKDKPPHFSARRCTLEMALFSIRGSMVS
jgi:hypothetical protein